MDSEDTNLANVRKYAVRTLQPQPQVAQTVPYTLPQPQAQPLAQPVYGGFEPISQPLQPQTQPLAQPVYGDFDPISQLLQAPMGAPLMLPPANPGYQPHPALMPPPGHPLPGDYPYGRQQQGRQDRMGRRRDDYYDRKGYDTPRRIPDVEYGGYADRTFERREPDYGYDIDRREMEPQMERRPRPLDRSPRGKKVIRRRGQGGDVEWKPAYTAIIVVVVILIVAAVAVAIWAGVTYSK